MDLLAQQQLHTASSTLGHMSTLSTLSTDSYNTQATDSILMTGPSMSLMHNIPDVSTTVVALQHFDDCDTNYPINEDPLQNTVCNESESHNFMDDTRKCLIDEKQKGTGTVKRHIDCWGKAVNGTS